MIAASRICRYGMVYFLSLPANNTIVQLAATQSGRAFAVTAAMAESKLTADDFCALPHAASLVKEWKELALPQDCTSHVARCCVEPTQAFILTCHMFMISSATINYIDLDCATGR